MQTFVMESFVIPGELRIDIDVWRVCIFGLEAAFVMAYSSILIVRRLPANQTVDSSTLTFNLTWLTLEKSGFNFADLDVGDLKKN